MNHLFSCQFRNLMPTTHITYSSHKPLTTYHPSIHPSITHSLTRHTAQVIHPPPPPTPTPTPSHTHSHSLTPTIYLNLGNILYDMGNLSFAPDFIIPSEPETLFVPLTQFHSLQKFDARDPNGLLPIIYELLNFYKV
jgi:hypothetical protein